MYCIYTVHAFQSPGPTIFPRGAETAPFTRRAKASVEPVLTDGRVKLSDKTPRETTAQSLVDRISNLPGWPAIQLMAGKGNSSFSNCKDE